MFARRLCCQAICAALRSHYSVRCRFQVWELGSWARDAQIFTSRLMGMTGGLERGLRRPQLGRMARLPLLNAHEILSVIFGSDAVHRAERSPWRSRQAGTSLC